MFGQSANDGYFHLTGTAAGTTSVMNYGGNFNVYTVGTATTGTVTFFDSSGTLMGTTAANRMLSFTGAVVNAQPWTKTKNGLLAVVSGTIDALVGCG
jgi:hypothetical protein